MTVKELAHDIELLIRMGHGDLEIRLDVEDENEYELTNWSLVHEVGGGSPTHVTLNSDDDFELSPEQAHRREKFHEWEKAMDMEKETKEEFFKRWFVDISTDELRERRLEFFDELYARGWNKTEKEKEIER